jgi:diacylglycerol kinase (ATP)
LKRVHVLINPVAGGRRCRKLYPGVIRRLGEAGVTCDVAVSQHPGHMTELASDLAVRGCEAVVAFGGDGTVNEVINGIAGTETALGIVPLGTANDFAVNMGVKNIDTACDLLRGTQTRKIDLVRVNQDRFFCGTACLGFDAEVAAFARSRKIDPFFMHVMGGLFKFFSFKPKTVELRFDGQRLFGNVFLVAFGNIRSYAKGMLITPQAAFDDALLDICVVRGMPRRRVLAIFPSVYKGAHVKHKEVDLYQAGAVFVHSLGPMDLYADGDFMAKTPIRLEVVPRHLKVISVLPPS